MLKAGMVGVGCISGIYLKNFTEVFRDVELVALCDLIRSRAEEAQLLHGVIKLWNIQSLDMTEILSHLRLKKFAVIFLKSISIICL